MVGLCVWGGGSVCICLCEHPIHLTHVDSLSSTVAPWRLGGRTGKSPRKSCSCRATLSSEQKTITGICVLVLWV